ncbi:MAG: OmpH family outer membrane protein [Rhodothermaceae bacterium]|nr:OmpH family outer membrane protein [Rhodothermaceae bacterium]
MTFRSLTRTVGLLALLLLPLVGAQAQANRIGYLDPDIIIVQMPEYTQVRDSLQAREQLIAGDLQQRENELRTKFQELQELADSPVLTADARQEREQEILTMQADLEQRQQVGLQELGRYEAQQLQPLLLRLQEAIDAVGDEMGLALVISARANNAPVILYASDAAVNITEAVLTRLGIEITSDAGSN